MSIVRSGRVGFESVGDFDEPSPRGAVVSVETGPTFVQFARGEPPTMMFTGYSGGAHCCLISRAYATPAIGPIHGEEAFWGDASTGPHIAYDRRSGRFVVVWWREPGDYPFVEPGPLELWSFEDGRFRNVTQNFADLVRLQAEDDFDTLRSALHARREQPERPSLDETQLGELADAFIEDEYVAGEGREGRRRFEALDMTDADRHRLTLFIDRYPSEVRARTPIDARW